MNAGGPTRRLLQMLRWVFGPAAVAFLLIAAFSARGMFEQTLRQVQLVPFFISVALWSLSHLLAPALAWAILRGSGVQIRYAQAVAIHVGRLPARYLPGGVWHTVSRLVDYGRLGASRNQLGLLFVLENCIPLGVTTLLGGSVLLLLSRPGWLAITAAAAGILLLSLVPLLLRYRRWAHLATFAPADYLRAVAVTFVFWPLAATAFCVYWLSLPQAAQSPPLLALAAMYLLSWAAGFATIFTPQGAGVFEASIAALLGGAAPFADTVVLAAGFRIVILLADLIAYGVYLLVRLRYGDGMPSPAIRADLPPEQTRGRA